MKYQSTLSTVRGLINAADDMREFYFEMQSASISWHRSEFRCRPLASTAWRRTIFGTAIAMVLSTRPTASCTTSSESSRWIKRPRSTASAWAWYSPSSYGLTAIHSAYASQALSDASRIGSELSSSLLRSSGYLVLTNTKYQRQ